LEVDAEDFYQWPVRELNLEGRELGEECGMLIFHAGPVSAALLKNNNCANTISTTKFYYFYNG